MSMKRDPHPATLRNNTHCGEYYAEKQKILRGPKRLIRLSGIFRAGYMLDSH
jgi:hypothetical protein